MNIDACDSEDVSVLFRVNRQPQGFPMVEYSLLLPGTLFFTYMSLLWLIGIKVRNAGLVDFGWPSGFTALAIYYGWLGQGNWQRTLLIVGMFALCGLRFMVGWTVRTIRDGEDRRWEFCRQRWRRGEGWFGIRSPAANFFVFYHAQTFTTLLVMMVPLMLACNNDRPQIHLLEWIAVCMWVFSFAMENVSDYQLDRFRSDSRQRGAICRTGLWRYSRHPNYFFEFLIWLAYAMFALPSATTLSHIFLLLLVPLTAYWFLVYFTGLPMTEQASLERRGAAYSQYQEETNRFFPWFPKKCDASSPETTL